MNSMHDMGGMMGFGPVLPEADEPVFHEPWEGRSLAINLAMGPFGRWGGGKSRFARECLPPVQYLTMSYYQIWLEAFVNLLIADGFVTAAELNAGRMIDKPSTKTVAMTPAAAAAMLANGRSSIRPSQSAQRFKVGDPVRAINIHPTGHTRLPRYVRGRLGIITHVHGSHVFPDSFATGTGEDPQWLYTVRFEASELWGSTADPMVSVSVEAWETYLEPCP